ncbi:MAG: HAD-IC family P-type ATPase [Tepidisphaeraceae bacterium]
MTESVASPPSAAPAATEATPAHALPIDAVIGQLGTDGAAGLSGAEAARRLARNGPNELAHAPPEPWWKRLARQFTDLLIWILIAAAIISGVLGEWIDAFAILAIVILNGILGFVQEGRAEQALAALRKLSSPHAKTLRDGRSQNLLASELVPGDLIHLEPGDRVPADVRLINTSALRAEEAALTGESVPADKDHREELEPDAPLGDRVNMAYMGTTIAAGTASGIVVATVPEGLSAVVTVALALGLQRMARRNALIRRLPSVETLGAVTVICSDKTGTLTRNEMTVREIHAGGKRYEVTGGGYEPRGEFRKFDGGGDGQSDGESGRSPHESG